jgi:tripartite-type tricarboxylate transporter receptor subunit TctC
VLIETPHRRSHPGWIGQDHNAMRRPLRHSIPRWARRAPLSRRLGALAAALLLGLALGPALPAAAQDRGRTMRLIVPFPPGGSADAVARVVAGPLGSVLGGSVVIDNRAGAGGLLGLEACARAVPDGSTLCFGTSGTHTVMPLLYPDRVGADPAGFTPIARLATEPTGLFVRADHPARSFQEFLAWGRAQQQVHFATAGITAGTLVTLLVADTTGIKLEPVVYRGGAAGQMAMLAGDVPVAMGLLSQYGSQLRSGEARAVILLSAERSRHLPDVPSLRETVLPDFALSAFQGLFGPAGLPPAIVERIMAALTAAYEDPAFLARLATIGVDAGLAGPGEFSRWLAGNEPQWRLLFQRAQAVLPGDAGLLPGAPAPSR